MGTNDPTAPATDTRASSTERESTRGSASPAEDATTPVDALNDLRPRLAELMEYVRYFISAKVDALWLTVRNVGIFATLGVLGLIGLITFMAMTVVLLCRGVAGALAAAMGGRVWAGDLVTAVLFLALTGLGVWIGWKRITGSSRERMGKKYAQEQQRQRGQFGTDVKQRAASPAQHRDE